MFLLLALIVAALVSYGFFNVRLYGHDDFVGATVAGFFVVAFAVGALVYAHHRDWLYPAQTYTVTQGDEVYRCKVKPGESAWCNSPANRIK